MRAPIPSLVAACLLPACSGVAQEPVRAPPPQSDLSSCQADGLRGLIGAPVSQLPQDGSWSTLRVMRPGQMMTMDFSATRLNVRVDGQDIVVALSCG